MRRFVVAGIVVALALTACGGGAGTGKQASKVSTLALVAGSPAAAEQAGTAHFEGRIRVDLDGESADVPFEGDLDFDSFAMSMSMDFGAVPGAPAGFDRIEARLVDGSMYMNLGPLLGELPGIAAGVEWVSIEADEFGELGDLSESSATENPADMLQGLRDAGEVEVIGEESIGGVATTHYRAQVDLDAALEGLSGDARDSVDDVRELLPSAIPMDVWIDDDGLPRRFVMDVTVDDSTVMYAEFEFSDYGGPVDISAPPADETTSFTELFGGSASVAFD